MIQDSNGPLPSPREAFPDGVKVIGFVQIKRAQGWFQVPLPVGAQILQIAQADEESGMMSVLAEPSAERERVSFICLVSGDAVPTSQLGNVSFVGTFVGKNQAGNPDLVHVFRQTSRLVKLS